MLDMSDNEMAKLHVRYMVGGHAPGLAGRADLPLPVPGAARRPAEVPQRAVRQLEHHPVPLPQPWRRLWPGAGRHPGSAAERAQLKRSLDELGYPYWDESDNPAYRSFLNRDAVRLSY